MRAKIKVLLLVFILLGICAQFSFAQAKGQKPQLYMIYDNVVKPAMASKFEAAIKEELAVYAEVKFPYSISAYSSDDFHYYFLMPIENHAAIDAVNKADEDVMKKNKERMEAMMKSVAGTFEYCRGGLIYLRPDLSYAAAEPRIKPEEVNFIYWGLASVEFGKEREFEEIIKQFVTLYKSDNVSLGFATYAGDMGTDMPFYFWSEGGKSAADFFSEDEKTNKILGAKATELWNKLLTCLRKYESKTGLPRPDLSYTPKKK